MRTEIKYIAEDGTPFQSPEECEIYEKEFASYAENTFLYNGVGERLPYDITKKGLESHMFVKFLTEAAANRYFRACEENGFIAPVIEREKPGVGSFFYDCVWHAVSVECAELNERIGPLGNVVFHAH